MEYVIIGAVILLAIYLYVQKEESGSAPPVSMDVDNSGWEEAKKQKAESLTALKKSFKPAPDNETALAQASTALVAFHENHGQSPDDITMAVEDLGLPDDLVKREVSLRKQINKYYKQRSELKPKAIAIHLAFEHAKLQLQNPEHDWNNFGGLHKLQSNWKAEEYFNELLVLMTAYKNTFLNSSNAEKLSSDIERMFKLWNSKNIALQNYEALIESYERAQSASDKHFLILSIIGYLNRRYKFNPAYKDELIAWCLKDIALYESFLKEFYEHELFSIDQRVEFFGDPYLKQEKLAEISFERVKKLDEYTVPKLDSYDVLSNIYAEERNQERLQWLQGIADYIGYINNVPAAPQDTKAAFDYKTITREIEVPKSGQKGKLAFLNSKGEPCSTEDAFKDDVEQKGWRVMWAEVSFWQAMFCLVFWDEIFERMESPSRGQDIPYDLFQGKHFYLNRQKAIDSRYEQIKQINLPAFINQQINRAEGSWTRLIYNGDQDMLAYSKSAIVQEFVSRISSDTFAEIVYRIAQNPAENRSGVFDFVIWNDHELKMVEVKRVREKIRESQMLWLSWMIEKKIPAEIVQVKGK